jgi:hypothetical protein
MLTSSSLHAPVKAEFRVLFALRDRIAAKPIHVTRHAALRQDARRPIHATAPPNGRFSRRETLARVQLLGFNLNKMG